MIFGSSKAITGMRLDEETACISVLEFQKATHLGVSAVLDALAAGTEVYVSRAARRVRERLTSERVFETREQARHSAVQRMTSPNTAARDTISSPS